jgi:pimeloyl-ACP methyl ester carboxylesterase
MRETRREVETPLGPVWFWTRDRGQPVLLLITGTFAAADTLDGLDEVLEGVDVWRAHLPGNHCPQLASPSVGMFAAAYSHAVGRALAGREVVACGLSVGGLVALGLRAPNMRGLVVVEPPLLTESLWPLALVRDQAPEGHDAFLWQVLGIARDRLEPRDYSGLLRALQLPTRALVGGATPPAPQDFTIMPSFVTPGCRSLLDAHPQVTVVEATGAGHNVPARATLTFVQTVEAACRDAFGPQVRFRPANAPR